MLTYHSGRVAPWFLGFLGGFEPDHGHRRGYLASGHQRQPLINLRESPGRFTLQTQNTQQMVVCQQRNGELAADIRQAGRQNLALKRKFVANAFDAGAHRARHDHLTAQMCVADRRALRCRNADDALTDGHFRANSGNRRIRGWQQ